eukprot:3306381-Rhodomonas_salina.1
MGRTPGSRSGRGVRSRNSSAGSSRTARQVRRLGTPHTSRSVLSGSGTRDVVCGCSRGQSSDQRGACCGMPGPDRRLFCWQEIASVRKGNSSMVSTFLTTAGSSPTVTPQN